MGTGHRIAVPGFVRTTRSPAIASADRSPRPSPSILALDLGRRPWSAIEIVDQQRQSKTAESIRLPRENRVYCAHPNPASPSSRFALTALNAAA